MRPEQRKLIHDAVLKARSLLEEEISSLLEGTYGVHQDGSLEDASSLPALKKDSEAALTRQALEYYLAEQEQAGQARKEARANLIKETAFTHLNRLVALRMMEVRQLIRGTVNKGLDSNQFKHWLAQDEKGLKLFQGGGKDRAYRLFLSSTNLGLSQEIKVLFDPDTLPSRFFPRSSALAELLTLINSEELEPAWAEDEAIGWVYQYFNEEEKKEVFDRLYKKKQKIKKEVLLHKVWVKQGPSSTICECFITSKTSAERRDDGQTRVYRPTGRGTRIHGCSPALRRGKR